MLLIYIIVVCSIFAAIVASFIIAIKVGKKKGIKLDDNNVAEALFNIGFFMVFFCPVLSVAFIEWDSHIELVNQEYVKLVCEIQSLKTNSEISGSGNFCFILGHGYIKETSYYYYYAKSEKGLYLDKVETTDTYIIETDDIVPSLYVIKEKGSESVYRNLYVPTNTIRQEFNF